MKMAKYKEVKQYADMSGCSLCSREPDDNEMVFINTEKGCYVCTHCIFKCLENILEGHK